MLRVSAVLLRVLLVLGLVLPELALGIALSAPSAAARFAAPQAPADDSASPDLASRRARTKKDRHQDRHKKRQQGRKQDRQQTKDQNASRNQPGTANGTRGRQLSGGRLPAAFAVATAANQPLTVEDRYIVVLNPTTASVRSIAQDFATSGQQITPTHVYEHVFDGFAAVIPDDQIDDVRSDPRVQAVVPDEIVTIAAQTVPTGIRRINAHTNPTAKIDGINDPMNVDVAVVDTAGDDAHPDLNIWAWDNCTDSPNNFDDHGHGTHVGGTIGAIDNDIGVVGVAPGARLWNFRVLKANPGGGATGFNSWIICGLDLVTQYATPQPDGLGDIEVANASLGGPGADDDCTVANAYHFAYCSAVNAGVTFVVAAGNSTLDAGGFVPATFKEVITVSALADSDGVPGGLGPATSAGADDSLATFSNFGQDDVNIAAPGVDILSTVPSGACEMCDPSGFGLSSGTSMASPHVAGAAALILAVHPAMTPTQIRDALDNGRELIALPGDTNDTDDEGVLQVVFIPPVTVSPPPVTPDPVLPKKKKKKKKKRGGGRRRR